MLISFIFSYFLLSSLYICRESSTNPPLFIQNKPNLQKAQINVNSVLTKDYENVHLHRRAKTNPIKPNTNPIYEMPKMNVSSFDTSKYVKLDTLAVGKNKPNSKPIKTPIFNPKLSIHPQNLPEIFPNSPFF